MNHNKQWYIDRIGKRIYRPIAGTCDCKLCRSVENHGLIVLDAQHADYLYLCQCEMGLCYTDKKDGKP